MLTDDYMLAETSLITIAPDRQRRDIDVENLVESITRMGIINPLVVTPELQLVAGERRLTAARQLNMKFVPVRLTTDLPPSELKLLELDENVRRKDLSWQDQARAVEEMFSLFKGMNPGGTQADFSAYIGYTPGHISRQLQVAESLRSAAPSVVNAPTLRKAINVVSRQAERAANNALADVLDAVYTPDADAGASPDATVVRSPDSDILQSSFLDWAPNYSGPRFNFLHCDFPYGIDLDQSDQLQAGKVEHQRLATYADSEEVYWRLLECLARNASTLLSSSAHVIFWFSFKHYDATRDFFRSQLPMIELDDFPLVWMKSDNRGIAPDVERQPRRIYETALFGRIGDRKNVKLISNAYAAPKANGPHPSEKPVPVLRHFFSMVCDDHTRLLDPTCGSGSSLRAAESLGAASVLGLEIDPDFAASARAELKRARSLALASGGK